MPCEFLYIQNGIGFNDCEWMIHLDHSVFDCDLLSDENEVCFDRIRIEFFLVQLSRLVHRVICEREHIIRYNDPLE